MRIRSKVLSSLWPDASWCWSVQLSGISCLTSERKCDGKKQWMSQGGCWWSVYGSGCAVDVLVFNAESGVIMKGITSYLWGLLILVSPFFLD